MVTWLRNKFYDWGIFQSSEYEIPTICVGNLSVGGTGKTPMIEYLIRLLKDDFKIATLSRGYKRSTHGFIIADEMATALSIGDEPFQFYNKFEDVIVSVDADRRNGISRLLELENPPQVILLDDAFQHRKVKAKFNVLLTPYNDLYVNDILLPTGNLREPKRGAKRADVIVVTKCPQSITENEKQRIIDLIKPHSYQNVFFSWISYSEFIKNSVEEKPLNYVSDKKLTLVTGIANPKPLLEYMKSVRLDFEHLNFKDHHEFTSSEIENLRTKEFILTTEKDFMRLSSHFEGSENVYYLPIELRIDKTNEFNELVKTIIK
jgi:tetraacyldisaccharide 4'-kinase